MKTNRVCKTCGKQYFYCSHCDKTLNTPTWMLMWHDENCKNVFETVSAFLQKQIDKKEAKRRLEKCDLRHLYTFKDSVRSVVETIFEEEKVEIKSSTIEEKSQKKTISKRSRSRRN